MKFVKMTIQYFTPKKFIKLILVALVPAILLACISTMSTISDFLINYKRMDLSSFNAIIRKVSEFRFREIPIYIIVVAIFIIGLSVIIGTVERDMRVGDFKLKNFFRRVNNNAFAVGLTVLFFMGSILIMGILAAAFFFLWSFIKSQIIAHILSIATAIVLFILLLICWVNFLLIIPTMIITGQSTINCIRDSIRHTQGIFRQLIISISMPLLPTFLLIYTERALGLNIEFILDVIINALLIVYYCVLMLIVFYEITGLLREDLNPRKRYFR